MKNEFKVEVDKLNDMIEKLQEQAQRLDDMIDKNKIDDKDLVDDVRSTIFQCEQLQYIP